MDVGLGWLGIGIGIIGFAAMYRMAMQAVKSEEQIDVTTGRQPRLTIGSILVLTLLFWAVSMFQEKPFSTGQTLGLGFLIGGISSALAIFVFSRYDRLIDSARAFRLSANSVAFLSLFTVSLTYIIFHGDPNYALIGYSIGAIMASILYRYTQQPNSISGMYTEAWAVFSISTALAIVFAVRHFNQLELRYWLALPILLAATVAIAGYIGTEVSQTRRWRDRQDGQTYVVASLISAFLVLILGAVYSYRLVADLQFLAVVAVGIGVAAIVGWVAAVSHIGGKSQDEVGSYLPEAASITVLLLVAFVVVAFKLWSGLGIAFGLLAAWSVLFPLMGVPQSGSDEGIEKAQSVVRALLGILSLGLVFLLFRLFVEQYRDDLGTIDVRVHYTFIGAVLGAILPIIYSSSLSRIRGAAKDQAGVKLLLNVGLIGLTAAVIPLLLFMIWDIKVVLGLVFGITAGVAMLTILQLSNRSQNSNIADISTVLLAVGLQLAAVQFIAPLMGLELTRYLRIIILGAVVLLGILWFVFSGILAARREK